VVKRIGMFFIYIFLFTNMLNALFIILFSKYFSSCEYLANKYIPNTIKNPLGTSCVCICDDDNDLEMALACNHAYIPSITSSSMKNVIDNNPNQFTVTCDHKGEESGSGEEEDIGLMVKATEDALSRIIQRVVDAGNV